jgi:hypothetical protein
MSIVNGYTKIIFQLIRDEKEELKNMLLKDKADMNRELIQKNEAYEALVENVRFLEKNSLNETVVNNWIDNF